MDQRWPTYEVAPDESIHAIGVMSINFARFERSIVWMLAAVGNLPEAEAVPIIAKLNNPDRMSHISDLVAKSDLPEGTVRHVQHYLNAMNVLVANRNLLIHSNIIRGLHNEPAMYKMKRDGSTIFLQGSLQVLRDVADELNEYFYFGLNVANYIAGEFHRAALEAGMLVVEELPPLPKTPVPIADRTKAVT